MDVEPSTSVGAEVEHMEEAEPLILVVVHDQLANHRNQKRVGNWANLHILVVDGVVDGGEGERLNSVLDVLESVIDTPTIGHGGVGGVEVDEGGPVLGHHGGVVRLEEFDNQS